MAGLDIDSPLLACAALPPPHAVMSDFLVDAVADRISRDPATFASLPLPLAHRVFLALPVDARGRASCVCRAWRDALAEPSLWTRLDLSDVRVEGQRFLDVLRGAAGRARNQLFRSRSEAFRGTCCCRC